MKISMNKFKTTIKHQQHPHLLRKDWLLRNIQLLHIKMDFKDPALVHRDMESIIHPNLESHMLLNLLMVKLTMIRQGKVQWNFMIKYKINK